MIHPLAHVEGSAVSEFATVWQFASVIRGAVVERETVIGAGTMVDGVRIGRNCRIGHNASLHPGTSIGEACFIGPGAIVCNDMWPAVSRDGFDMEALLEGERKTVIIEDGASIGAGAIILPGIRIGAGAVVAAGAVVERDVTPGCVYRRNGYQSFVPVDRHEKRMRFAKC